MTGHELSQAFHVVDALTQDQRDSAYEDARERIAGKEPVLRVQIGSTKYPAWMTRTVLALTAIFLAFAFIPSAQRLNAVALETNRQIDGVGEDTSSIYVAAVSTVLMAEVGQVLFSLAAATVNVRQKRVWRIPLPSALGLASYVCLAIAISGNALALGDYALSSPIAFLETYAPPVLVLISASILKAQMLNAVHARYEAKTHYDNALVAWENAYATADSHPAWERTLANALWNALRDANKSKKKVVRELSAFDKRMLVLRERSAEEWWERIDQEVQISIETAPPEPEIALPAPVALRTQGTSGGRTTHELDNAVHQDASGVWVGTCPYCATEFQNETEKGAKNALSAHAGRFCKARKGGRHA